MVKLTQVVESVNAVNRAAVPNGQTVGNASALGCPTVERDNIPVTSDKSSSARPSGTRSNSKGGVIREDRVLPTTASTILLPEENCLPVPKGNC